MIDSDLIIYSDTDSGYATIAPLIPEGTEEENITFAIKTADEIAEIVNNLFPKFMDAHFLCGEENGAIIKAARETVVRKGIFPEGKKKRYALYILDQEGIRVNKVKTIGMETRRTDTPKYIQQFLEDVIKLVIVENKTYNEVLEFVNDFRVKFRNMDDWKKGTPCGVSNIHNGERIISEYEDALEDAVTVKKKMIHFSVTASMNTNKLIDLHKETRLDYIRDGDKIEILNLKSNPYKVDTIALKVGEDYVPDWIKSLPFDNKFHEQKLIDKKLHNIFGVLKWDFQYIDNDLDELFG